jgi:hypothetical protein
VPERETHTRGAEAEVSARMLPCSVCADSSVVVALARHFRMPITPRKIRYEDMSMKVEDILH